MKSTRRKRRCINPTRSSTKTEHGKTIAFPAEIWRQMLLNLWYDEEDHESIRSCRLVSHSFKDLVDSLPPKLYWNPWLKFSHGHHSDSYLSNSLATNFTRDDEIYEFLKQLPSPNSAAEGANPFPVNQTVRLFKRLEFIHKNGSKDKLKNILDKYGSYIKKLIFHPPFDTKCLSDISRILPSMVNLETLIISENYELFEWVKCPKNSYPTDPRKLSELAVVDGFLPKNDDRSIFFSLADAYGAQIKHLTLPYICFRTDSSRILEKFPNLENLKVTDLHVNETYLEKPLIGNSWPRLRRLALRTRSCEEGFIGFKNILKLVSLFSLTLELLSLDVGRIAASESESEGIIRYGRENDEGDDVLFITPFPQLKKMILPFCFVSRSQQTLEERFNFDFPELKVVILQDFEEEFQADQISQVELSRICTPLWRLVPPSVDTICVRTETWKEHLEMRVPVVYKCSRTPAL